jgi:hypothetical protein
MNNRVTVALVAALLVPWVERETGVKLTDDQVAGLVALAVAAWHAAAPIAQRVFDRFFPPTQAAQPPKA